MTGLMIRLMECTDVVALCAADGGETPENRECFERYFYWQQEGECAFLLAFFNEQLAGHLFVFYHDVPGGREELDIPRLADLLVYMPFRHRGVAQALLERGEQLASTVCDKVFLTVEPENPIRQAYERRGYRYFCEEADELVMVKQMR